MGGETLVTRTQVVNIGQQLRAELERAARQEDRDATSLGRELIREGLARLKSDPSATAGTVERS